MPSHERSRISVPEIVFGNASRLMRLSSFNIAALTVNVSVGMPITPGRYKIFRKLAVDSTEPGQKDSRD